jgi:hypothetical protein
MASLVSDNKILICGGWSEERGNSSLGYTVDLQSGKIDYLAALNTAGWTVLPPYYFNGSFYMFQQGEETNKLPDAIIYKMNTPHY